MDVTPLIPEGRQIVQGYADGHFMVSQVVYDGPVIVMPEQTVAWPIAWTSDSDETALLGAFDIASLEALFQIDGTFDILLIGCGRKQVFIRPDVRQSIRDKGPVVEMMDTGAACRTYNLLLAEERRVAAALLPIPNLKSRPAP
jgi:uncharacterized protein